MTRTFACFWSKFHENNGLLAEDRSPPIVPNQNSARLRIGATVRCTDHKGVFRPCHCGSEDFVVAPGVGPHRAQLKCQYCRRGGRWLSRFLLEEPAP